jgi:two-component system OmpR family response regulator
MPRALIADDDPVSLRFLAAALEQLGCEVVTTANATQALAATGPSIDLLLLDRRMPGMGGAELLAALRERGIRAPAIATSAEVDMAIESQLRAAGFIDVIAKPVGVARLHDALRRHLRATTSAPLFDEVTALAATGGDAEALRALRGLLADELAGIAEEMSRSDRAAQCERLHRLRASCGFCGAAALGDAARQLEFALREGAADAPALLHDFLRACVLTRDALQSGAAIR